MIYIFLVIILGAAFIIISNGKKIDKQNSELQNQGYKLHNFLLAGKYISGHTLINNPIERAIIYTDKNDLKIFEQDLKSGLKKYVAEIKNESISGIVVEDETTIQTRVGLKRLIALGIFAFALKKKDKKELAYLIIEWNQGQFNNETVFEFEGANAITRANTVRNKIINQISSANGAEEYIDPVIKGHILAGSNLAAVKYYHELTGASVHEAKKYISSIENTVKSTR